MHAYIRTHAPIHTRTHTHTYSSLCDDDCQSGEMEDGLLKVMDLNTYIDGIISEILKYANKRMIVISCFHPDACLMYVIIVT